MDADLRDKVIETNRKHALFDKGAHIVVGVSGGPDSMALLHVLIRLRKTWALKLSVVHVHHGLRGASADADLSYVEAFCKANELTCYCFREDVRKLAQERGVSVETAGRDIRYERFKEVCEQCDGTYVAVAHHANDVIETFFHRLFRGTGIDGLASIAYKRAPNIIRPLLDVTRAEIEAYCDAHALSPRYDESNLENTYTRNALRNHVIPFLKNEVDPQLEAHILRVAQLCKDERAFWEGYVAQRISDMAIETASGLHIESSDFETFSKAEQRHMVRGIVKRVRGNQQDLSFELVERMIGLESTGTQIEIDRDHWWIKTSTGYDCVRKQATQRQEPKLYLTTLSDKDFEKYVLKSDEIVVDADKIMGKVYLRHREPGDRFAPLGMNGSKKLKDFLIDMKIPQYQRDQMWLVCDAEKIVWIPPYRISERVKCTKSTQHFMIIGFENIV